MFLKMPGALLYLRGDMLKWAHGASLYRRAVESRGKEVTLKGWLDKRSSGKIHFLQVRDGTGICQCVASLNDLGAERSRRRII